MDRRTRKVFFDLYGLKQGKQDDFEALFFNMYDTLFYLALSYVKVNEIAEDLVQDSFIQLWKNRDKLEENTNAHNYLYTLTKHNCLNYLKRLEVEDRYICNKSLAEIKFLQQSVNSLPDSFTDLMGIKQDLHDAIEKLPEDIREIFKLSRYEGLKYIEIAQKMNISIKTVEVQIGKALKKLRDDLKQYLT